MANLRYPFPEPPAHGTIREIADGLYWLRMPLPMALDHINLYMLEDRDGWWIIDTGIGKDNVREFWRQIFEHSLNGKIVKGVIVTHMHPDHVGQAAWICETWRAPLYMSCSEYYHARTYAAMTAEDLGWSTREFFIHAGLDENFYDLMKSKFKGFASVIDGMPCSFRRLSEGRELIINEQTWRVMIGAGHSPEHVCLFNAEKNILLAGDQIIPRITPNISVLAVEPEANPLAEWLLSIEKFLQLPAETLVLPAHNLPFYGVHERLIYLRDHHQDHLDAILEHCSNPQTTVELLPVLFDRELDGSQLTFALGECVAHVNYLVALGALAREVDSAGCYRYRTIDTRFIRNAGIAHHRDPPPIQV